MKADIPKQTDILTASTLKTTARTALVAGVATLLLSGCASMGYYWQSVNGHMKMMNSARLVDEVLADSQTPAQLKVRLILSQRIRSFAVTELKLPDNASYHRYADLHRSAVVWNVVAAPEFSLTLKTWCFPVVGCVGYRGYFNEAAAHLEGDALKARGFEVGVYGVPAYSSLGWMNWAGGDPLLNTFINYPEGELARLIFHELAHQVAFANGDTVFNESFATTVERLGIRHWMESQSNDEVRKQYAVFDKRRQEFRALTHATRRELAKVYGEKDAATYKKSPPEGNEPVTKIEKVLANEKDKAIVLHNFREKYIKLKSDWGGYPGYDAWVGKANNALFGAQAAYDELVPGFEALFEREGRDWSRFYGAVKQLSDLPEDARHKILRIDK